MQFGYVKKYIKYKFINIMVLNTTSKTHPKLLLIKQAHKLQI